QVSSYRGPSILSLERVLGSPVATRRPSHIGAERLTSMLREVETHGRFRRIVEPHTRVMPAATVVIYRPRTRTYITMLHAVGAVSVTPHAPIETKRRVYPFYWFISARGRSIPMSKATIHVAAIVSAPFEENTYVAYLDGRKDCLVVDPGL